MSSNTIRALEKIVSKSYGRAVDDTKPGDFVINMDEAKRSHKISLTNEKTLSACGGSLQEDGHRLESSYLSHDILSVDVGLDLWLLSSWTYAAFHVRFSTPSHCSMADTNSWRWVVAFNGMADP
jgi:hypothetical protein